MCKFCDNKEKGKSIPNESLDLEYVNATINGNQLSIGYDAYSCDSSFSIDMTINFCPMCGRDLNPKVFRKGDKFTFKHPDYPNSSIVGKVMIAEEVTSSYIEPKSNDLVCRQFPIQYCTKVID